MPTRRSKTEIFNSICCIHVWMACRACRAVLIECTCFCIFHFIIRFVFGSAGAAVKIVDSIVSPMLALQREKWIRFFLVRHIKSKWFLGPAFTPFSKYISLSLGGCVTFALHQCLLWIHVHLVCASLDSQYSWLTDFYESSLKSEQRTSKDVLFIFSTSWNLSEMCDVHMRVWVSRYVSLWQLAFENERTRKWRKQTTQFWHQINFIHSPRRALKSLEHLVRGSCLNIFSSSALDMNPWSHFSTPFFFSLSFCVVHCVWSRRIRMVFFFFVGWVSWKSFRSWNSKQTELLEWILLDDSQAMLLRRAMWYELKKKIWN